MQIGLSLALTRLGAVGGSRTLTQRALAILRTYGTDAHLWLPGVGAVNGITAGNFSDTAGTTEAIVDSTAGVGLVVDAGGGTINATQSTTASKPILRRGAVNRATDSNNFASWAPSNLSFADSGIALPFGSGNATRATLTASPGTLNRTLTKPAVSMVVTGSIYAHESSVPFTLSVDDSTTTNRSMVVCTPATGSVGAVTNAGNFTGGAVSVVSVGAGWYRFVLTTTTNNSANYRIRPFATGTAGESVVLAYAQLEYGSTANTYIPTTTAPASSPTGPMYWELDGSTDFLTLGAVPFQLQDGFCVVLGARSTSTTAPQRAVSLRTGAALLQLEYEGNNNRWIFTSNDGTTAANIYTPINNCPVNTQAVVAVRKTGNSRLLRGNAGALFSGTNSTVQGSTSIANANIGKDASGGFAQFNGNIGPVIAIKGTVSDADLLTLERWVGSLSGVTIP